MEPKYDHDCDRCEYLGTYNEHDLYYCESGGPTVLARFDDSGPGYSSGLELAKAKALDDVPERPFWGRALRVAYLIARDRGKVF